jgi:hypothetical protein
VINESTAEGVVASLHYENGEVLWLRVEHDRGVGFEQVGPATLVVGRTRERGPFFLTGSFARHPKKARRVIVEYDGQPHEPPIADDGWVYLLSGLIEGPVTIRWLDDEGVQHEAIEYPSLDEIGTLGPTRYGPPREPPGAPA